MKTDTIWDICYNYIFSTPDWLCYTVCWILTVMLFTFWFLRKRLRHIYYPAEPQQGHPIKLPGGDASSCDPGSDASTLPNDMDIKIYIGAGVSEESVIHTYHTLKQHAPCNKIDYISPVEIIQGDWINNTRLLVLPGGADIPYVKALNGPGNDMIKKFIMQGGNFLGICAGSYYSGNYLEFAKSTDLEVVGERELALFQGTVRGPILCDYYYNSDKGARAAKIIMDQCIDYSYKDCHVFYNGGGYFVDAENVPNTKVVARYDIPESYPAIIECKYGKGNVILSGVHFEYDPYLMIRESLSDIAIILKQENQKRISFLQYLLKILLRKS